MLYLSPDEKSIGFGAGEDVCLRWKIYEDSSRRVEYKMKEDDVITFCIRERASADSAELIRAESAPGDACVYISGADTAWIRPGQYTAIAVISIPSRNIDEMMIYPPIDGDSQGVFPAGNCVIAAGGRSVSGHG